MQVRITNWKKISSGLFVIGAVFIFLSLEVKAATQSDAIAVRIMPNTNHESIETWYKNQGLKGSPQSLIVDGYEAIRDGRTVFVNAANLDSVNKKLYTNIYLISYNQESEIKTLDILGQLVSHWKFNSNIPESGYCSISTINCQADAECSTGYICSNGSGLGSDHAAFNKGKCILNINRACNIDSDCPVNLFCDSLKASSVRDVKRLGNLNQINSAIESFKSSTGSYPGLQSGTYIPGNSLSVWPSWKETLWSQLGLTQVLLDPINSLGYCSGYDAVTCWNNKTNKFVNPDFVLPSGSHVLAYKASTNGVNYTLCSVFETKDFGYDTLDKKISSHQCSAIVNYTGTAANTPPFVVDSSLSGVSGKEFNGYIKAKDNEGDAISWELYVTSPSSWKSSGWQFGINTSLAVQDTGDATQKKIYAPIAGNPGTYAATLKLTDSRGAVSEKIIEIVISKPGKPIIEAADITYFIDPVNPLDYYFSLESGNVEPAYSVTPLNPSLGTVNSVIALAFSSANRTSIGLNKSKISFSLLFPLSMSISQDVTVPFRITATANGISSTKDVNFDLKIEKPYLNFKCEEVARIGQPYQINGTSCLLGKSVSGNHSLIYSILAGPAGLKITYSNGNAYLSATSINESVPSLKETKISVVNEYKAKDEKSFNIKVNNFCGDNVKQSPNTEGRGGRANDGMEECDGKDGVAPGLSFVPTLQYGCTSGLNTTTPYPILNNSSCVFKAANAGGGYCGDGYCQLKIDGVVRETGCNCPQDCLSVNACCGDGVVSANEVCDTGMPDQPCTEKFTDEIPGYCGNVPLSGSRSCKADCSGWNKCNLLAPVIDFQTSTGCMSTNVDMLGYSCCELQTCVNDGCDCCGRYEGDGRGQWLDLAAIASQSGYLSKKALSPNNGLCVVSDSNPTICECGSNNCMDRPWCPKFFEPKDKKNDSCVVAQDQKNLKNWKLLTNHTTATAKCWK